jgi:hypothetical protein
VSGVDQLVVDFVGQDDDVFFDRDVCECLEGGDGVNATSGVAGTIEHEHAGAWRDGISELFGGEAEAVLFAGFDEHRGGHRPVRRGRSS